MIGIPLALAVFGYGEWATHKYLLHELGANKDSRFAFHYHTHHQSVRRNGGYDPDYEGPVWSTPTQAREAIGLVAVGLAHLPLLPIAPFYTATVWYCLHRYRRDHRRAHLDPEWARTHLRCHYDHHMGDQKKNFGIGFEWFDRLVGTRVPYVGTEKDAADRARNRERADAAARGEPARREHRKPFRVVLGELRAELAGKGTARRRGRSGVRSGAGGEPRVQTSA
jgi:sterol desaturase/sphingolipid hydroxylase (fatty acid hydroxylase superfamily)